MNKMVESLSSTLAAVILLLSDEKHISIEKSAMIISESVLKFGRVFTDTEGAKKQNEKPLKTAL